MLVGTAFRVSPGRCLLTLLGPLAGVIGTLGMVAVASLVNGVVAGITGSVAISAALVAGSFPVGTLLRMVASNARIGLSEAIGFAFDRQIAELVAGIPGLEHHERIEFADQLQVLRASRGALGDALDQIISVLNVVVQLVVLLVALVSPTPTPTCRHSPT